MMLRGGVPPVRAGVEKWSCSHTVGTLPSPKILSMSACGVTWIGRVDKGRSAASEVVERHADDEDGPVQEHPRQRAPRPADRDDHQAAHDPEQEPLAIERDAAAAHEPHEHHEVGDERQPPEHDPWVDAARGRAGVDHGGRRGEGRGANRAGPAAGRRSSRTWAGTRTSRRGGCRPVCR